MNNEGQGGTMKRRLRAYKKTVSIVNEKAIELYKGLGIEKKGFLLEGTDKESGQYTFMGVEPNEIIQSDKNSLVITRKDGSREVREGNPLIRLKEYFDEFEIVKDPGELDFLGGLVGSLGYDYIRYTEVLPDDNPDEIGIETIQLMLADKFIAINHTAETFTAVVLGEDSEEGRIKALKEAEELIKAAREGVDKFKDDKPDMSLEGVILKKSDMTLDDIDYIVCHQANERIINHVKKKYPGHEDKFYINIAEYGNTSAASIPIALDELAQSGCFDKGRKLILAGFGAGLSWSSALIET